MADEGFAKSKSMELPRQIVVGHDAILQIGEVAKAIKVPQRGLIIADENTREIAGEKVLAVLTEAGYNIDPIIIDDASQDIVNHVQDRAIDDKAGFLLGVGGGRPIDVAKAASYNIDVPFISVPTAASHDGIVSARASITVDGVKQSLDARTPLAVVADTAIIVSAPYRLLAAGCGDIVSNLTAVLDWQLASRLRNEYFSSYASTLAEITSKLLIGNANVIKPGIEEAAWFVAKALVSSGVSMSIAGSSRPASGSEHMFSHALDRITPGKAMHGEQCGVGTIMMMYLHGGSWEMIKDALTIIGAPTTARQLGLESEDVLEALMHAHEIRPDRYTILGESGLTREAAEHVARVTKVID